MKRHVRRSTLLCWTAPRWSTWRYCIARTPRVCRRRVGGRLPAHATGVGKALLSASDPEVIDRAIAAGLVAVGPRTIRNPDVLRQQLRRAAVNGIAYEQEESAAGVVCVASAVLDSENVPVAAISASGWAGKVDIRRVGPAVHTAALSVSRVLASRDT